MAENRTPDSFNDHNEGHIDNGEANLSVRIRTSSWDVIWELM